MVSPYALVRYAHLPGERIEPSLAPVHDFGRAPRAAALTDLLRP
jgi:hypothetical protein